MMWEAKEVPGRCCPLKPRAARGSQLIRGQVFVGIGGWQRGTSRGNSLWYYGIFQKEGLSLVMVGLDCKQRGLNSTCSQW